jgi:putative ABC transport system permease protein
MIIRSSFTISFKALVRNKSRSALTILGIVIGIASIMMIFTVGQGAESSILNELSGLGAETIVIRPGQEPTGPSDFAETLFSDSLKISDIEALLKKANVPTLESVSPGVIVPGSVSYGGDTFKGVTFGWSAELLVDNFNLYAEKGAFFDDGAISRKESVAVIGKKVEEELFGNEESLGKNIKIKGRNFRIVGVTPPTGQLAFFNVDEMILIPWSTAQTYLLGIDHFHEVIVKATSPEVVDRTVRDIELTLRETHEITDPSKDDFFVVTQEGLVNQIASILQILTLFLAAVVTIALVVGGVGVMNIMLVSVTERTKEIGLRKAVGATNANIKFQFLIEAVTLTLAGGLFGIFIGTLLSFLISISITQFTTFNWPFVFPVLAAVIGTFGSAAVGLVFGIYPASQAAKKSPIESLRYE